ncbi:hypothetical protein GCM10011515_05380 [Tsuneonella deserti]|uniref:Uncharacterized protein n=1 Tax=Tsuneonella deserti TaxID=2035528 RepID=A0ABQ1S208_9SPHN|nr:hypothetical protein GCM10011515_05380 [Tsuneonella deserti]
MLACAGARIAHFCSTCGSGPQSHEWTEDNFCSMKITQEVCNFAAKQERRGGMFRRGRGGGSWDGGDERAFRNGNDLYGRAE